VRLGGMPRRNSGPGIAFSLDSIDGPRLGFGKRFWRPYDKTVRNYSAILAIACIVLWLRL